METFSATKEFYTVVIGGTILSVIGGCINASVLTGRLGQTVSHVTGNLTRLGSDLVLGTLSQAGGPVAGITLSFFLGSLVSGVLMDSTQFSRSYAVALLLESSVLFGSWILDTLGYVTVSGFCASFACGFQNAFCSGYSSAVLRTTHMSGITTDIGIICGQLLRRNRRAASWKLKVLVPLWFGFLLGVVIGTGLTLAVNENAILVPASVLFGMGVFYLTWAPARCALNFPVQDASPRVSIHEDDDRVLIPEIMSPVSLL